MFFTMKRVVSLDYREQEVGVSSKRQVNVSDLFTTLTYTVRAQLQKYDHSMIDSIVDIMISLRQKSLNERIFARNSRRITWNK